MSCNFLTFFQVIGMVLGIMQDSHSSGFNNVVTKEIVSGFGHRGVVGGKVSGLFGSPSNAGIFSESGIIV